MGPSFADALGYSGYTAPSTAPSLKILLLSFFIQSLLHHDHNLLIEMKLSVVKKSFKNVAGEHLQVTTRKESNYLQVSVCKEEKKPPISTLFKLLLLFSLMAYSQLYLCYKLLIMTMVSIYFVQTLRRTVTKETILLIRSISGDSLQYSMFYLFGRQSTRHLPANELAICETLKYNRIIYNLIIIGAGQQHNSKLDNVVLLKASLPRLDCLKYIYNQITEFQRDIEAIHIKSLCHLVMSAREQLPSL